jgi:ribonuclease J
MRIYGIGGYNEVGKNMTAVDLGEDVFLFDGGLYLPPIVELEESEKKYTEHKLRSIGAIPDDTILDKLNLRNKVRAIIPSHAHLDHIGALPYLAHRYNCDIIGTPFTIEVLNSILRDEHIMLKNKLKSVQPNSFVYVKGKNRRYRVDFINMTHSTIHMSLLALHTPEGIVLYCNDFKLDNTPILGKKPNYEKLKEISKQGVKAMIVDSLYAGDERKTASEKVARTLLEEVLLHTNNERNGLIVTTFSSHIARLKSIVEFGKKLDRRVVFLGRSLNKYTRAAMKVDMAPFRNDIRLATYRNQLEKELNKIDKDRTNYMIVCTGHQGEPGSILDRMSRGKLPFRFNKGDNIVFSSSVIPTEVNIENRDGLDSRLKKRGTRLFNNVHVSGHGGREDIRELIELVNPEHVIPSHGGRDKTEPCVDIAIELGYKDKKQIHLLSNGQKVTL